MRHFLAIPDFTTEELYELLSLAADMKSGRYSAQALTAARVRRIPRAMLERMIEERPELAQRFLRMAAVELMATRDHLVCLAAKSAGAKVASLLLALSRRNRALGHDPAQIRLSMTRTDIGDYLGLTIETVSRSLSKLKRDRVVRFLTAQDLQIADPKRLSALAGAEDEWKPTTTL